jgi:ABC-type sugar transport system substrate-binding protein
VPTVTDDADLPNSNRLAFVGTDWYDVGVAQANALIQATGGKGQVAALTIINADNTRLALSGFKATLAAKAPGLKLVAVEDDGGQEPTAVTDTSNLLAAHPGLTAIAGFDAESGPGAVVALGEAHKLGKVKVSTMEATPSFFNNLKTGAVTAIIVQKRELFTYYALMLLYDYNHDGLAVEGLPVSAATPIPVNIDTGIAVVTKASVGQIKTG